MAAPSYTEDLTDIDLANSTTGWSAYGGGGAGLGVGADFAIQGANGLDKQVSSATKGAMHNDATVTLGASDHIWVWLFSGTPGICDSLANGGWRVSVGSGTTARNDYYVDGNDTRPQGGYKCFCVRYSTSTPSPGSQTGSPAATPTYFGGGLTTTASAKGVNLGLDAVRYGTGAYITAGDGTTPATFDGFATQDELNANKWGILFRENGTYQWQGRFVVGQNNSGTATAAHMDDTEVATITITDTPHSQTDFTQLIVDHASTIFNLSNKTFISLGTNNKGKTVITNGSATSTGMDSCTFIGYGTTECHANIDFTNIRYLNCDQVTAKGNSIAGSSFEDYSGASNTSALLYDETSDPSTDFDDLTFDVGSGTTHAIEFGLNSPTTINLSGLTSIGYNASNAQNDSFFHVKRTSGTVTINVSGGTGNFSYRTDGATVVVNATVPMDFEVLDKDGTAISGAQVSAYLTSDDSEIFTPVDTNGSGLVSESFAGTTPADFYYRIRKASTGATKYVNDSATGTITADGFTVTRTLRVDPNNNT